MYFIYICPHLVTPLNCTANPKQTQKTGYTIWLQFYFLQNNLGQSENGQNLVYCTKLNLKNECRQDDFSLILYHQPLLSPPPPPPPPSKAKSWLNYIGCRSLIKLLVTLARCYLHPNIKDKTVSRFCSFLLTVIRNVNMKLRWNAEKMTFSVL